MERNDKEWALDKAIEIMKEHARGGGSGHPPSVLEELYKKLKELLSNSRE